MEILALNLPNTTEESLLATSLLIDLEKITGIIMGVLIF
jgi:hypothetical protein